VALALFLVILGMKTALAGEASAPQRYFVLPMELETDGGAANGDATLLRFMPSYNWGVGENWQILNVDMILLADAPGGVPGRPGNPEPEPEPVPGDRARGLSDWIHASFFNPIRESGPVVGVGFLASAPTATDPALGSGRWGIGPALRFAWNSDSWRVGAFGGQRWSFGGNEDRADFSQLLIRGTVLYEPEGPWFFVSAPIITANWKASRGDRWLVPLGGGIGRKFGPRGRQWRASVQFYGNAARPEGAPAWSARLGLTAVLER
jgi:hypothetical protein